MSRPDPPTPSNDGKAPTRRTGISWERAANLFAAALKVPASERKEWLNNVTGVDEALRQEVASLLEANEKARGFLIPED